VANFDEDSITMAAGQKALNGMNPAVVDGAFMASPQELIFGDAAAAFMIGNDKVIAEFKGSFSLSYDFADHYRGKRPMTASGRTAGSGAWDLTSSFPRQ